MRRKFHLESLSPFDFGDFVDGGATGNMQEEELFGGGVDWGNAGDMPGVKGPGNCQVCMFEALRRSEFPRSMHLKCLLRLCIWRRPHRKADIKVRGVKVRGLEKTST